MRDFSLHPGEPGTLTFVSPQTGTTKVRVYACPAEPATVRGYLSLRDLSGREVAVISTLAEVDARSRHLLESCLTPHGPQDDSLGHTA